MVDIFIPGLRTAFIFFATSVISIFFSIWYAQNRKLPQIRSIPALDAIQEAVGRAAEMGRPLHYTSGVGGLVDQWAPLTVTAMSILGYTAKLAGEAGIVMRYTTNQPYLLPIAEDLIKSGYTIGGHPELYKPEFVHFPGNEQMAMVADIQGYLVREKVAANLMFGAVFWEAVYIMGAGAIIGSMNIAGTPRLWYIPIIITTCDYVMIGDEIYAAAAIVEKNPANIGTIFGQDIIKGIAMGLLVLSVVLISAGTTWFTSLINW